MAVLIPIPACAIASASVRSLFAVPNISQACFMAFPGRYPTSILFAHHLYTISEPMLFFWSTIDQSAFARLVEQSLDVLLAPVLPAADRDGATQFQAHYPVRWPPHIYPEIEALLPEPVFLLALHDGTLLLGRQASVSEGRHPHYPAYRVAHPYQPFSDRPPSLSSNTPRAFVRGRGTRLSGEGRPAAPFRGHLQG
jgi:hypothetical protein